MSMQRKSFGQMVCPIARGLERLAEWWSILILSDALRGGNKHFAPEGASVLLVNTKTGDAVDPVLVDRATGRPVEEPEYAFAAGPAAGERTRRRCTISGSACPRSVRHPVQQARPRGWRPWCGASARARRRFK
jgi:hypothetical protein